MDSEGSMYAFLASLILPYAVCVILSLTFVACPSRGESDFHFAQEIHPTPDFFVSEGDLGAIPFNCKQKCDPFVYYPWTSYIPTTYSSNPNAKLAVSSHGPNHGSGVEIH